MSTTSNASVAFVDTETTGLDADRHEIWEVAVDIDGQEHQWFLPVDLGKADAIALRIGRFHERHPHGDQNHDRDIYVTELDEFATEFAELTRGRHLVGAVVSFDDERLRKLLRANGSCPEWHYHLIDVEALAVGFLMGIEPAHREIVLPWDSSSLSAMVRVDPNDFDKHTALGDVRWAKAIYERVMGSNPVSGEEGGQP